MDIARHHQRNRFGTFGTCAAIVLLGALTQAATAEPANTTHSPDSKHCINLRSLHDTRVLDDRHIVFETNDRKRYLTTLPHRCPGLRRGTPFMYRVSLPELCNLDLVTVLETAGGGFMPGASCGLGDFEPISADDEKALKEEIRARS